MAVVLPLVRRRALFFAALVALAVPTTSRALTTSVFQTPARNIHCVESPAESFAVGGSLGAYLRCDVEFITRYDYYHQPPSCHLEYGYAFEATARGHGNVICASDSANVRSAQRLTVGVTRRFGGFRCTAPTRKSIRCNNGHHHGFALSEGSQRVY